jgi:Secretion system C-terminal sorting domain
MRRTALVFCFVFATAVALAGSSERRGSPESQPMQIDNGRIGSPVIARPGQPQDPPHAAAITWIAVDTMANAFGPASRGVKPMAYDSATNIVALIHRGGGSYAQSSGELWYNVSRDAGGSWRRVGGLNSGAELFSRYPSCAISNPTNSNDTSDVFFIYAAPLLLAGGSNFGRVMWGTDFPLGSGGAVAFQSTDPDGSFWSNAHIWGANGRPEINWVVYRRGTIVYDDLYHWQTTDFLTYQEGVPATWATTSFNSAFGLDIGGQERNGVHYFGKWGQWAGDPNVVDNPGYSTSTDAGVSWSAWTRPQPDWRSIPGLGGYDFWTYGGPGAYSMDMVVDANGRVHFFGVTLDTLTAERQLVEIYETGSGWSSNWITTDLKESTRLNYPGVAGDLNQMGNHLNAAINVSGTVMSLVWLDGAVQGDTLPDIWFSYRGISDASWSTPENLTETPGFPELLLQAAPTLKSNGSNSYTMFIGRSYESGLATYPPESGNPTVFYAGTHTFTANPTGVGESSVQPQKFALSQNYPNPFNPSTTIDYVVAREGFVTIKVYDALGREVATLLNEERQRGRYQINFDAAKLASGIYMYKISGDGFSQTKKMVLMK